MKKNIFLCLQLCALVLLSSCTKKDYSELIVGKWNPEYALEEYFDKNGVCIKTDRYNDIEQGIIEFRQDGTYNQDGTIYHLFNPTYSIVGNKLTINVGGEYNITYDIRELNEKSLHISTDYYEEGEYDGSFPEGTKMIKTHYVFKRI